MKERSMSEDGYRFGFNGKENDRDFGNDQLIQDYGFRVYNPALGKFLSVDPLTRSYPMLTSYQFASNTPVWAIDLDGLEGVAANDIDYTWLGGIILAKNDFNNIADQIGSEIHAFLDPRLPDGFRVRTSYSVQYDSEGVSYVVKGDTEIVPTEVAREGLFWNMVGTSLIPLQFVDFTGARGTVMASSKNLIPWIKKSTAELLSGFQTGELTRRAFKSVSYTKLRGNLEAAGQVANVGDQAHHLVPLSTVLNSEIAQKAVRLGFDFNSARNGEFIDIFTHLGENYYNHPIYNQYANKLIENLSSKNGDDLLKGMNNVIEELRSVVNEAKKSKNLSLDDVANSRLSKEK